MSIVTPTSERLPQDDFYICSFCSGPILIGAFWVGPNISVCKGCLLSGHAPDILGRLLGDALYAAHGGTAYANEVERILSRIEMGIWRTLYNSARLAGTKGENR